MNEILQSKENKNKLPLSDDDLILYFEKKHKIKVSEKLKSTILNFGYDRVKEIAIFIIDENKNRERQNLEVVKLTNHKKIDFSSTGIQSIYDLDVHVRNILKGYIEFFEIKFTNCIFNVVARNALEIAKSNDDKDNWIKYLTDPKIFKPTFNNDYKVKFNEDMPFFKVRAGNDTRAITPNDFWKNTKQSLTFGKVRVIFGALSQPMQISILKLLFDLQQDNLIPILKDFKESLKALNDIRNRINHAEQLTKTAKVQWSSKVKKLCNNPYMMALMEIKNVFPKTEKIKNTINAQIGKSNNFICENIVLETLRGEKW